MYGRSSRFMGIAWIMLGLYFLVALVLFHAWLIYLPVVRPAATVLMALIVHRMIQISRSAKGGG